MNEYEDFPINIPVSFASSGDNEIIAAPATGRIVIDNLNFVPASAVGAKLIRGSTDLSGRYSLTANQGYTQENSAGSRWGVLRCLPGEAFKINIDSAVQCSGFCDY